MQPHTLTLTEYETSTNVALTTAEAGWLKLHAPGLEVRPTWHTRDRYDLTPGHHVGTIALPHLTLLIRPKIAAERVLFLISYSLDSTRWQELTSGMAPQTELVEGMAALFGMALRKALAQGAQQGYRSKQESLSSVRGRIRFDEQLRKRFLMLIPLEVEYDDFTLDTDLNRLLYEALRRLRRLPLRSKAVRSLLAGCHAAFVDGVTPVEFEPNRLPEIHWNRLNQWFRPAAELAEEILARASIELQHGDLRGTAFTIDMNVVFEQFVRMSVGQALGLSPPAWPPRPRSEVMDVERRITLKPDLTWVEGGRVVFVGDAKYKRVAQGGAPNADLYQLHAYATALALPYGLLVYAEGEQRETVHTVQNSGIRLIVRTLDVDGQPAQVLEGVRDLAVLVRKLRVKTSHPGALLPTSGFGFTSTPKP